MNYFNISRKYRTGHSILEIDVEKVCNYVEK